jgi:integrase
LRIKDQADFIKSIECVTNGLPKFVYKQLTQQILRENAVIIVEFIKCQKTETYKNIVIQSLIVFIRYFKNKKFKQLTRADIINYLDSLRKPEEVDPLHKWIGTYNLRRRLFLKFFKWLYYPAIQAKKRPIPKVMRDILQLKRKEESIYKRDDLWTQDDDRLFFKYCPDKRIQCYHAVSRDASTRPDEILKLRVKDINFKLSGDKTYAEISVNGKTGSRVIPLFNSIPYIRDWIKNHPQPGNSNALLIPSMSNARSSRKLSPLSLNGIYRDYKTKIFPRLMSDENVPKTKIRL